ncbi:histidine kinase dimerization/phospho-acceptor domain-containing protein [Peribacillus sp. SCS-155]|uniref:sensor histidine kinase n=1 Tax=Peribacillus sedimenti TaxID=3115297 RepID=UPI0039057E0F
MATKSKNSILFIIWSLLTSAGIMGTVFFLVHLNNHSLTRNYFDSVAFNEKYGHFLNLLSIYELNIKNREDIKSKIEVSKEEIEEYRYRYGTLSEQTANIYSQYESKIEDARNAKREEVAKLYEKERDRKLEDITNNFKNDEYVREKVIREKLNRVDEYFKELGNYRQDFEADKDVFVYHLRNLDTKEIYANINGAKLQDDVDQGKVNFSRSYSAAGNDILNTEDNTILTGYDDVVAVIKDGESQKYEGTIAIPKNITSNNPVMTENQDYKKMQMLYYTFSGMGVISLLISVLLYWKKRQAILIDYMKTIKILYDRIPLDVRILLFCLNIICSLWALAAMNEQYLFNPYSYLLDQLITGSLITMIFLTVTIIQAMWLIPVLKDSEKMAFQLKRGVVFRSSSMLKMAFLQKSIGIQLFLCLGVILASGFGLGVVLFIPETSFIYIILFLAVTVPTFVIMMKRIGYFNMIIKNANQLAEGRTAPDLPVTGKSSVLAKLAANVNTLKQGVNASQREQAKSERLKTELITNVSHDLRTPLTSIITYTELMKTPELTEDDRKAYLEIIDRKSKRLKILIDDLFEASKMASGNIELYQEKIDIIQLLHQALGEYDEMIKHSTLKFRLNIREKPIYAYVDGQKIWRVFDNLIGNILKYSLNQTRVYISVNHINGHAVITFKNVSQFELGGDTDELLERFKRGDASRHTEGSGLGLAISKSIVDLHGGNLEIEADGDLFKVSVTLEALEGAA